MDLEQYKLISARRIASNNLVWQTPTLASAAQAFLITTAANPVLSGLTPVAFGIFSIIVGVASLQLMIRHRRLELEDAELLARFERSQLRSGLEVLHGQPIPHLPSAPQWRHKIWIWLANTRSSFIWTWILCGFIALGFFVTIRAVARMTISYVC